MRIRTRVESLERRASPTGECACHENRSPYMLYCRDPSVPPPPVKTCPRCTRPMRRLIVHRPAPLPGELPDEGPAHEEFPTLREFYAGTVRRFPAYQEIAAGGLRAIVCGREPEPTGEAP